LADSAIEDADGDAGLLMEFQGEAVADEEECEVGFMGR
jgi:hypothetical protein